MKDRKWLLVLVATLGVVTIGDASLVYYPFVQDVQNVLSPVNLCERLCGQCGCEGMFLAENVCQCSCNHRGCDPGYANCTLGMFRVCDESDVDCEFPQEQEVGLRTRDARGHKCMDCHESHDCDSHGGGYDDGYGHGHDYDHGDGGKKFTCCKRKKHKKCKHGKKRHRKINIKIKGKLPDCCYFNHYEEPEHYRTPEKKRIPEEPEPVVEPMTEPPPEPEPEPTPEPRHYVDEEEPKRCCNSKSDVHCDNCYFNKDSSYASSDNSNGYRAAPQEPKDEPLPPEPSKTNKQPSKDSGFRNYGVDSYVPTYPAYSGSDSCSGGYCGGGHAVEFSHHKVVIPGDHLKPILEKMFDYPVPAQHPIDLTVYNQIVNTQLYDDVKAGHYGTELFQPTQQPHRDYYEAQSYQTAPVLFPPGPPSYQQKNYLPLSPPPGAYVAPVSSYSQPSYYSGYGDRGPAVFEIMNDSPPPALQPPPHYLQVQQGSFYPFDEEKYRVGSSSRMTNAWATSSARQPNPWPVSAKQFQPAFNSGAYYKK